MLRTNIDRNWQFVKSGLQSYSPAMTASAETVHLPHDFTISTDVTPDAPDVQGAGYYQGGIGSYTKMLDIPEAMAGQRVLVEIDGAYRNAEVSLGGNLVCIQPNGNMPFHADLTPYIKPGQNNRLSIAVNNSAPYDSRWYNGSGIYRHVDLLTGPMIHLEPWGIFVRTERVDPDGTAIVLADVTVSNRTAQPVTEQVEICLAPESEPESAVTARKPVTVPALGQGIARFRLVVDSARLWDLDNPRLYRATARLDSGDADETLFGIRTISVDPKFGFRLNGREIKLKGGCVHHTNGLLGAVSLYDAEYRKFNALKQAGYNAVRCAHNPPSRDMLEACDRLGLLVLNEAFDMWRMRDGRLAGDYHLFFESHWKQDLERMVLRDRNHPSIFMWSIGNEIGERNGLSNGYAMAAEISGYLRDLDDTRPLTSALPVQFNGLDDDDMAKMLKAWADRAKTQQADGIQNLDNAFADETWGAMTEPFAAPLDVVGYNYLESRYEKDHAVWPDRVICGLESFPAEIDRVWSKVEKMSCVIGDFTWTAFDYIGEAGLGQTAYVSEQVAGQANPLQGMPVNFPWRTAFCGDFDIAGFERPQLHYRQVVWGSDQTFLLSRVPANLQKVEIPSRWGWPEAYAAWDYTGWEGKPVKVDVFSRADEVELILNGTIIGRQPVGPDNRFKTVFDLAYEPGELVAVSFTGGREISRTRLSTAGTAAAVRLSADRTVVRADGQSLVHVTAEIVDDHGRRVCFDDKFAEATVEGGMDLLAFGTGRPVTDQNYTSGSFTSHLGRWMAILRAGTKPDSAGLTIQADGLPPATLLITLEPMNSDQDQE